MLDIGSSDGLLARAVADRIGVAHPLGVDVKLQPNAAIEVRAYDGSVLPFESASFDLVTVCDVLHHAANPRVVVQEAMRVLKPQGSLVIKDHFRWGSWSNGVLLAMDIFGNYKAGVLVRGHYLTPPAWVDLVLAAGGRIDALRWPVDVHDTPIRWVARSQYQFAMRVRHANVVSAPTERAVDPALARA